MAPLQTPTDGSRLRSEYNQETLQRDTEDWKEHQGDGKRGTFKSSSLEILAVPGKISFPASRTITSIWGLLLASLVSFSLQQSNGLRVWGSSNESEFTDSNAGVFSSHSAQSFFVFAYMNSDWNNKYFIKAYSTSGTILGSFSRQGDNCFGVAMLTSTRFVVAPKTTHDYLTVEAQVNGGQVVFASVPSRTRQQKTGEDSTILVGEQDTDYVYVGQQSVNILLLTGVQFSVNKFSTAGNSNNALRFTDSNPGVFTIKAIELFGGSAVLLAGSSILFHNYYAVIEKSTMRDVLTKNPSSILFAAKVEPLDTTSMYMSFNDNSVGKLQIISGNVLQSIGAGELQTSLSRPSKFFFLFAASGNGSPKVRVLNLTSYTYTFSFDLSGYAGDLSLTLGDLLYGRNQSFGLVNTGSRNINTFMFMQDYCVVPFQLTCTACTSGRYLTSNSSDYQCLLPAEFPIGYGNDTTYMQPCLGSLTSGCTSCPTTYLTCVACNTASGYYLYAQLSICYTVSTMPDTLGVNNGASPKVVTSCSDSNCLKCASDHTQCTQCKPSWYLKNPTDGKCYQNNIETWGILSPSPFGEIKKCSDKNCKWCLANFSACTECKSSTYFTQIAGNPCNTNTLIGFGFQSVGGDAVVLASCSDTNCLECFTDHTFCTKCRSPHLLDADDLVCKLSESRKGPDSSGIYLRNCTDSHCQQCTINNAQCQVCDPSYYFMFNDSSKCVQNDRAGFGLIRLGLTTSVISPCLDTNCMWCLEETRICTACIENYYQVVGQEFVHPSCFTNNQTKRGLNTDVPAKLDDCTVLGCEVCFSWNQGCDLCEPGLYVLESSSPVVCEKNDKIQRGLKKMVNRTQPLLSNCSLNECKDCFLDYQECRACLDGFVLNTSLGSCVPNNLEGQGQEFKTGGWVVQAKCQEAFCVDCFQNIKICNRCDATKYYQLKSGRCQLDQPASSSLDYLKPIYFDKSTNRFSILFSAPIHPIPNLQEQVAYQLVSLETGLALGKGLYSVSFAQESSTKISAQVYVSNSESIGPSVMHVSQRDQSVPLYGNGVNFIDPTEVIQIKGVGILSVNSLTPAGLQAVTQVASILSIITLGMGVKTSTGGQLPSMLKIIDSIEYVLYWNGIESLLGNKFIFFWSTDVLVLFPNYFETSELSLKCLPQEQFWRHGVSCSYFNNYGSQMITLMGLLAAFILVEAISFLSKSLKNRESVGWQRVGTVIFWVNWIPSKIFTAGLMLALLDGSQIEVIRLSFLTFSHFNTTPGMIGAAIVSLFATGMYVWLAYQLWIRAASMGSHEESEHSRIQPTQSIMDTLPTPRVREDTEAPTIPDETPQKPTESKLVELFQREIFGQFRKPKPGESRLYLYIPLMFLGKSVLTQGWLVFTPDLGSSQIWLFAVLELSYLVFLTILRPFRSNLTTLWNILSGASMIGIGVTHLVMNAIGHDIDFQTREKRFGYTLILLYSICILVTIVPGILENIRTAIDWIRIQRRPRATAIHFFPTRETLRTKKMPYQVSRTQSIFKNRFMTKGTSGPWVSSPRAGQSTSQIVPKKAQSGSLTSNLTKQDDKFNSRELKLISQPFESTTNPKPTQQTKGGKGISSKLSEIRKERTIRPTFRVKERIADFSTVPLVGNFGIGKQSFGELKMASTSPPQPKRLLTNRLVLGNKMAVSLDKLIPRSKDRSKFKGVASFSHLRPLEMDASTGSRHSLQMHLAPVVEASEPATLTPPSRQELPSSGIPNQAQDWTHPSAV